MLNGAGSRAADVATLQYVVNAVDSASAVFTRIAGSADDLLVKLDDLSSKTAEARVGLQGNKEAMVALDDLDLKIARFGKRVGEGKVGVDGLARAQIGVDRLDLALDRLNEKHSTAHVDVDVDRNSLRGILASIGGAVGAVGGTPVPMAGSLAVLLPAIAAAGAALILATPAIIGAGIALGSFAGFAALAAPEIEKVNKAVSKGGKLWKDLSPAEKDVGRELKGLHAQFRDLQRVIQPYVIKAFGEALKIVKDLMPAFEPLLKAAGKALDAFLGKMATWLQSPSGKKFIYWLETEGPKDIARFGGFLWGLANVFGRVIDFMYNTAQTGLRHLEILGHFFSIVLPNSVQIGRDEVRIAFDRMLTDAGGVVLGILNFFGHIPGPIGRHARDAADAVRTQLDRMRTDASATALSMQASFDRLHGKRVTITLHAVGGGSVHVSSSVKNAAGFLEFHARGARIPGYGGGDRHLALLEGGETVVPKELTPAVAPLMAAHGVPGFTLGGFISGIGRATAFAAGKESVFGHALGRDFGSGILGIFQRALKAVAGAFGFLGGNVASWITQSLRITRSPLSWLGALETLVSRESGGNPRAWNPVSVLGQHASGMWQMLPSTFAAYSLGGSIWNPVAEGAAAIRYIRAVYGSPYNIAGLLGGGAYYGYDRGGWLPPGLSLAYNGTGRPERVGGGGNTYISINVTAPVGTNRRQLGQELADVILAHTRAGGRLYPQGMTPR